MATKGLILLLVALAGVAGGWMLGTDHERAKQVAHYEKLLKDKDDAIEAERVTNGDVSAALAKERDAREADRMDFDRRLANARRKPETLVSVDCPQPDAGGVQPVPAAADRVPRVRFTADFVRLWDDGLGIGATPAERAGRADVDAAWSGVVEPTDLAANLRENAARWQQCRAQVRGWQSWACKHGFAVGSQCGG